MLWREARSPLDELVFLKLGGSLITDKSKRDTPRLDIIQRIGQEIARARAVRPGLRLVLGHGSGSFGHFAAQEYGVHRGGLEDWRGYAETAAAAARLNRMVADCMLRNGVPVVSMPPSASVSCKRGELVEMTVFPVETLLERGLVPLVYGDVALDVEQGCAIVSTEQVFVYLSERVHPRRMIIAGEVDGVFTADPLTDPDARRLPEITSTSFVSVRGMLSGSHGVDVTGGMLGKVDVLLDAIKRQHEMRIRLISGRREGAVEAALKGEAEGTLLRY